MQFELPTLETHATNVHVFGGLQFHKHGVYTVEIKIDGELSFRFPLPVIEVEGNEMP